MRKVLKSTYKIIALVLHSARAVEPIKFIKEFEYKIKKNSATYAVFCKILFDKTVSHSYANIRKIIEPTKLLRGLVVLIKEFLTR